VSLYRLWSRTITRRAGVLTPAARVGVAQTATRSRPRKASSTVSRWSFFSPAWWKATPPSTQSARRSPVSVDAESRTSCDIPDAPNPREARRSAVASALRRELTKTSACPPSSTVPRTRLSTSSPSAVVPSSNSTRPSAATPFFRSTGRQSDSTSSASNHPANSSAFATVALRATNWGSVRRRSFATVTSSVGPRSESSMRWTSSITTHETSRIQGRRYGRASRPSRSWRLLRRFLPGLRRVRRTRPSRRPRR